MNKDKLERVESLLNDIKQNLSRSEEDESSEPVFYDREAYLSAFEDRCESFGVEVELEEERSDEEVFSEWSDTVNMSAEELQKWSKNPCSRDASEEPLTVMRRTLDLMEKDESDWTGEDVMDAERTVSFVNSLSSEEMRPDSPREGPHGCPSEWAVSLLNAGFNPFSSVPSPSSEVKEDLEAVEKVSLQELEDDAGPSGYEFEPVPNQVLYSEESDARTRAENLGLEGTHEHVIIINGEEVTMYMPGDEHRDWEERVRGLPEKEEEMSETRKASEVVHGNEQERASEEDGDDGSVRVPPVAIHKVDGGTSVQVEDDVEQVLDELWENNNDDE